MSAGKTHYVVEVNIKSVEVGGDTSHSVGPGRGMQTAKVDRIIEELVRVVMKADDLEAAKEKAHKAIEIA